MTKQEKKKKEIKEIFVKTKYGTHLCRFVPDEKRGFIITAPGIQGVVTWGKDVKHGEKMAKEAIECVIECLVERDFLKLTQKANSFLKKREPVFV